MDSLWTMFVSSITTGVPEAEWDDEEEEFGDAVSEIENQLLGEPGTTSITDLRQQINFWDFVIDDIDKRQVNDKGKMLDLNLNEYDESKTSFHISYKDLELHFGKTLEEAANELGVSRSTLKRASKACGIKRRPSNAKNKKNPSLFLKKTSNKQISKPSRSNIPISNLLTCTGEVDKTRQETYMVTIKAKFKEDIIRFDMCLSSGLEKLTREVAKRLSLMIGNFKLKYKDDENDLILLTCDEDLQYYVKRKRLLGKNTSVQVLVHLVCN